MSGITITLNLSNLKHEIEDQVAEILEEKITDIFVDLTAPPPTGTPVDTGKARQGWQLDTSVRLDPKITNDVPYIARLNDGHSKQAPAGFIDAIVDKHTR